MPVSVELALSSRIWRNAQISDFCLNPWLPRRLPPVVWTEVGVGCVWLQQGTGRVACCASLGHLFVLFSVEASHHLFDIRVMLVLMLAPWIHSLYHHCLFFSCRVYKGWDTKNEAAQRRHLKDRKVEGEQSASVKLWTCVLGWESEGDVEACVSFFFLICFILCLWNCKKKRFSVDIVIVLLFHWAYFLCVFFCCLPWYLFVSLHL
jgi:hypothetical protein